MKYYYAGGKRVPLEPDESHVAVEEKAAARAGLGPLLEEAAAQGGRRLPGGVVLLPRSKLDAQSMARLQGRVRSVYRHGDAMVVPLPEIRVEMDDERQRSAVMDAIDTAPHPVEVSEKSASRVLLTPRSGSSEDAIDIANHVFEKARPAASSVRLLQFVPRPGVPKIR